MTPPLQWYPHRALICHTSAEYATPLKKVPEVIFWRRWEALLHYMYISGPTLLTTVWSEFAAARKKDFWKTLDFYWWETVRHLVLENTVIYNDADRIVIVVKLSGGCIHKKRLYQNKIGQYLVDISQETEY